jgi:hypothetical protein
MTLRLSTLQVNAIKLRIKSITTPHSPPWQGGEGGGLIKLNLMALPLRSLD